MNQTHQNEKVESNALGDFAKVMDLQTAQLPGRIDIKEDDAKNGLVQLALTIVRLIHELLERQAIQRMEAQSLTDEEVERVGNALMKQAEELERLKEVFGLTDEDLNLDLGPVGRLL